MQQPVVDRDRKVGRSASSVPYAAALQAGAGTLYTEDLQHWQLVRGTLRIVNPFLEVVHEA